MEAPPSPWLQQEKLLSAFVAARGIGLDILGGEPGYLWGHQVIAFSSPGWASSAAQTGFLSQVPIEHTYLQGQLELCPDSQPSDSFIYLLAVPWGPVPITGSSNDSHMDCRHDILSAVSHTHGSTSVRLES